MSEWTEWGGIGLSLMVALGGGIWAFRNNNDYVRKELREEATEAHAELSNELYDLRQEIDKIKEGTVVSIDRWTQRYGDSLMAIRQKITDMELWNRDNFATKAEVRTFSEDIKMLWREMDKKMDERFNRLERRLEHRRDDQSPR